MTEEHEHEKSKESRVEEGGEIMKKVHKKYFCSDNFTITFYSEKIIFLSL